MNKKLKAKINKLVKYYKLLDRGQKSRFRPILERELGKSQSAMDYKLNNLNFSSPEVLAFEKAIETFKKNRNIKALIF